MTQPESPIIPVQTEKRKLGVKSCFALGAIAASSVLGGLYWLDSKAGKVNEYNPVQPVPALIDDEFRIGSWNMHNEALDRAEEIKDAMEKHDLDVMALQEVNYDEYQELSWDVDLGDMYMRYVTADAKTKPLEGGYGNLLITRQKPKDVDATALNGTSLTESIVRTAKGFGTDVANADTTFKETKDGRQEDRAAIAQTVEMLDENGAKKDVRVITSHISGLEVVHNKQLDRLIKFIEKNTKDNQDTIFCGDLNDYRSRLKRLPMFKKKTFELPKTAQTSVQHKTTDYCVYNSAGAMKDDLVTVTVDPKFVTDHRLLVLKSKPNPTLLASNK